jgi:hypothetical protein
MDLRNCYSQSRLNIGFTIFSSLVGNRVVSSLFYCLGKCGNAWKWIVFEIYILCIRFNKIFFCLWIPTLQMVVLQYNINGIMQLLLYVLPLFWRLFTSYAFVYFSLKLSRESYCRVPTTPWQCHCSLHAVWPPYARASNITAHGIELQVLYDLQHAPVYVWTDAVPLYTHVLLYLVRTTAP